jgi:hypothetical protein
MTKYRSNSAQRVLQCVSDGRWHMLTATLKEYDKASITVCGIAAV